MLHSPASQQTAGCPCSVLPTVPTVSPVRRKRGSPPFPTTTAFPPLPLSPISPTTNRSHTICPYNSGTAYPHPQSTISRFCWPRFSTQLPPLFFPFFFTLIALDSVILSSSMLFFHSRDRDLSRSRDSAPMFTSNTTTNWRLLLLDSL
jgi:hypothetical protein